MATQPADVGDPQKQCSLLLASDLTFNSILLRGIGGIILHIMWKFPLTAEGHKSPLKPLEELTVCVEKLAHFLLLFKSLDLGG